MKTITTFLLSVIFCTNSYAQCYTTVQSFNGTIIARLTDGTLWTKGQNSGGISGTGTTAHITDFIQIGTDNHWSDNLSLSITHGLAIKNDGTLWAWGDNYLGSCGFGALTPGEIHVPRKIGSDNHWTYIASGTSHSLAVKSDGTLWSWGSNESGQLGIGDPSNNTQQLAPMQVGSDTHWLKVFTFGGSFAIKTDGTLWAWGYLNGSRVPQQVGTDTNWDMVSTAMGMTIGLKTNHTLWGWGLSGSSQFGDGTPNPGTSSSAFPIQIGTDNDWKQITVSANSCMALKINGTRWGWGNNFTEYSLGDGTTTHRAYPTQLDNDTDWIFATIDHENGPGIAIKQNNSLYQWGHIEFIPVVIHVPTLQGNACLLSTNDFEDVTSIKIFPNPVNGVVVINYNLNVSSTVKISMTDCLGKLVYKATIIGKANENVQQIDMNNFASGVYFVKMQTESKLFCGKIIKN